MTAAAAAVVGPRFRGGTGGDQFVVDDDIEVIEAGLETSDTLLEATVFSGP